MPTLSNDHAEERLQACRLPAMQATLDRLTGAGEVVSTIVLYDNETPTAPAAVALVSIPLTAAVGTINVYNTDPQNPTITLVVTAPREALVTGADPSTGTGPLGATVFDPAGVRVMDLTVSLTGAGGEVQMEPNVEEGGLPVVRLFNGSLARLTSISFGG